MKQTFIFLIRIYQLTISPFLHTVLGVKSGCRYPITCSEYTKQSIQRYGVIKGVRLGLLRFLSCQPFGTIQRT